MIANGKVARLDNIPRDMEGPRRERHKIAHKIAQRDWGLRACPMNGGVL